jgi:hypothetical protein
MDRRATPSARPAPKRVAMLVALPEDLWTQIRAEASDLGVGPSKVIEPVLIQAFGRACTEGAEDANRHPCGGRKS